MSRHTPRSRRILRPRVTLPAALALALVLTAATTTGQPNPADAIVSAERTDRPNIIMVMADDMRVDDLLFAPNVRRLIGRNGLTFDNSFSPFPLCCPARASFLTGQYAHNHNLYWHKRPYGYQAFDDSRTIGTSLKAAGYKTGYIGKYLNGYGPDTSKVSGGPSWKYVPNGWTDWRASFENPGVKGIHGGTYYYWDTPYNVNGEVDNAYKGQYQTNVIGDFSLDMTERFHKADKPFFMYVSYVAPHHGGPTENDDPGRVRRSDGKAEWFATPARPQWVKGKFDKVITRASGMRRNGRSAEKDVSDKRGFFADLPELRAQERAALTTVTRQRAEAVFVLDRQVGRLVRKLKATGEWDNTVLMFTSDNGYFLGEHRMRTGKVRAHEPSLRVPFLVTGPGMRSGETRYDPISTVDITATILDLANARAPLPADGISRVDSMRLGDQGWDVPVVTEAVHSGGRRGTAFGFAKGDARTSAGLRTARYSLTLYRSGGGELYDLVRDPAQFDDKFKKPAYRTVRRALIEAWHSYKDCSGEACRTVIAEQFRATAREEKVMSRQYWADIDAIFGR